MIKGLAITPPTIGRIAIGHVVERNGKRIPEKDDFFTITTQVQNRDGWLAHPLQAKLAEGCPNGKLRAIPVKLLFNSPELNLRAQYSAFDRSSGRPECVGDGHSARRNSDRGIEEVSCPSPGGCEYGREWGCKLFGRLNVQIDGQDDELGSFILRTTGYNSVRTLAARLEYLNAISGGNARHLPLTLRLRAKSTMLSYRTPVYYVDLTLREGDSLTEAVSNAQAEAKRQMEAGVDAVQLEQKARLALANGSFEESVDDGSAVVDEFYPEESEDEAGPETAPTTVTLTRPAKLTNRLGRT
ncbi:MAG: hypothetical protein IIA02_00750 [Proteobacteria bacterium]|uniref:recombination directionality factor n=1 Tax=Aquabacterium sp. TaxID=1872578 RepID=UPI0035C6D1F3|nr:hypothetical protein [Pseudomonadota bacterium]